MAHPDSLKAKNLRLLGKLGWVLVGMTIFAWALVPIYRLACQRLGIGNVPQRPSLAITPGVVGDRQVTVHLIGIVNAGAPARMFPLVPSVRLRVGETREVRYRFINLGDRPLEFQVVHSVDPPRADAMLHKLRCFCFSRQRLGPHETRELPVSFWVDPKLEPGLDDLTLQYSLFALHPEASASSLPQEDP